jgi:hypothetical protein
MSQRRSLRDIEQLCSAATPGPWVDNGNEIVAVSNPKVGIAGAMSDEDNAFIAAAREELPRLAGVLDKVQREVAECDYYNVTCACAYVETCDWELICEALRSASITP